MTHLMHRAHFLDYKLPGIFSGPYVFVALATGIPEARKLLTASINFSTSISVQQALLCHIAKRHWNRTAESILCDFPYCMRLHARRRNITRFNAFCCSQ